MRKNEQITGDKMTALHFAIIYIDDEDTLISVVSILLEFGAKIDAKDTDGRTALMHACERGSMRVVKYLVEMGADVNSVADDIWPVISFATDSIDILKYLIEKGADAKRLEDNEEFLRELIDKERTEVIELSIEYGLPVDTKVRGDRTLLLCAFIKGSWSICETLLEKGADINYANWRGPIIIGACYYGDDVGVMWLVDHGADVNIRHEGCPLLGWAISSKELKSTTVDYLIDHGARMSRR